MERQQQIIDGLPVHVFDTRAEMGAAAARGPPISSAKRLTKKAKRTLCSRRPLRRTT